MNDPAKDMELIATLLKSIHGQKQNQALFNYTKCLGITKMMPNTISTEA
jgi:hypothetical protein